MHLTPDSKRRFSVVGSIASAIYEAVSAWDLVKDNGPVWPVLVGAGAFGFFMFLVARAAEEDSQNVKAELHSRTKSQEVADLLTGHLSNG